MRDFESSASMMTQSLKGKTKAEAEKIFERFHKLVTGQRPAERRTSRNWASWLYFPAFPNFPCA